MGSAGALESATPKKLGVGSQFGVKQVSPAELLFGCIDTGHWGWAGCAKNSGGG